MLTCCTKNQSLISVMKCRNTCLTSATTSMQLALMHWNCNWCKVKHTQTCLYYNQVAWLPLSHATKSFWELHSHTLSELCRSATCLYPYHGIYGAQVSVCQFTFQVHREHDKMWYCTINNLKKLVPAYARHFTNWQHNILFIESKWMHSCAQKK